MTDAGRDSAEPDRKRILIVDDEPDIITYLQTALEDEGFRTMQARSADEAMKKLEQERPDMICMDIKMPGQSGLALYEKIMLDGRFRDIPAVFISAYSMARDFTAEGFRKLVPNPEVPAPAAYIEKPVNLEKLIETIRNLIR